MIIAPRNVWTGLLLIVLLFNAALAAELQAADAPPWASRHGCRMVYRTTPCPPALHCSCHRSNSRLFAPRSAQDGS